MICYYNKLFKEYEEYKPLKINTRKYKVLNYLSKQVAFI